MSWDDTIYADLKSLRYVCDRAIHSGHDNIGFDPAKIVALIDRIEAAEKDADRYRRLRSGTGYDAHALLDLAGREFTPGEMDAIFVR